MKIQPEERPQNIQEWVALLQVRPQNITSQMPQVFGKIYTQMSTYIPGVKRNISQNSLKSSYIGKANGLFIVAGILIFFLVVVYIFFPNLNFSRNSRPSIDKKIDYTALENLLSSYQFKEADEETLRILLSLVGGEKQYWFDLEDIKNIPCKDLDKINQLWVNYSNGKFGFSIQKQIWIELGSKIGIFDVAIADIFIKQVGWGEKYKRYKNITYKISASYGHIPFRATTHVRNFGVPYIAEKLAKCNM
ncbi:MAG: GUN4 domain-containing protein [Trichodesmium sp. MAG_R03]|nr:GUN4 domain-containing protein [Trichodesmium sp. MAG_R03]